MRDLPFPEQKCRRKSKLGCGESERVGLRSLEERTEGKDTVYLDYKINKNRGKKFLYKLSWSYFVTTPEKLTLSMLGRIL